MTILLTGAGGFLGTHVVESLLTHGCTDITCFLRDKEKAKTLLRIAETHPGAQLTLLFGNLRSNSDCVRAIKDVSHIFHLAAGLKGSPAELFADSVLASRNLLEALITRDGAKQARLVLVSSFGVYGVVPLGRGARINEQTPLESRPELRDTYSYSKLRQEQLFSDYQRKAGFELVILRPGVIYGPGGGAFSSRVGLQIGPELFHLGGDNLLPLSYVVNCAEAIVLAGLHPESAGQIYNVHDDDLPTASRYLREYKRRVKRVRSIFLPYFMTRFLAWCLAIYNYYSQGQLPAIITPYKAAALWGGNRFDNSKLHSLGWHQLVPTSIAMAEHFDYLRRSMNESAMTKVNPKRGEEITTGQLIKLITPPTFSGTKRIQLP